jgi:RNA polymerase sigma-70 factor (family 1)
MEDLARELLLIAQGNELAFNEFMNRYMEGLYYHAFGILSNKEMAEEVVSDVFLEVWRTRKTLTDIENLRAWLNTICYRKAISYLRKEKKYGKEIPVDELTNFSFPVTETPVDGMINHEEMDQLHCAIESLPPRCKYVFFLAKIEQLPYAQIAQVLDLSLATVNYHVSTATNALKKKLRHG